MVDLVERHGLRGRVVLQSFSLETLFAVQRVSPTTPRIMLIRELPAEPVPLAERLGRHRLRHDRGVRHRPCPARSRRCTRPASPCSATR